MYQVKVLDFAGPMEKLLELIEAKKLDITRISLAEVTADFLKYIHSLTKTDKTQTGAEDFSVSQRSVGVSPRLVGVSPRVLADFLVVASQLILIKSKAILPDVELSEEEEESIPIKTTAIVVVIAIILSFLISISLINILGSDSSGTSLDTGTVVVQITPENNQGTIQVNFKDEGILNTSGTP